MDKIKFRLQANVFNATSHPFFKKKIFQIRFENTCKRIILRSEFFKNSEVRIKYKNSRL